MGQGRSGQRTLAAGAATLALIGGAGVALLSHPAGSQAASDPSVITGGQTIASGSALQSPAGLYTLTMGTDGNLVLSTGGGHALWASNTSGNPGADAVLQPNGELVVQASTGETVWSDNVTGAGCAALNVLDDGSLAVEGTSSALWSTAENPDMFSDDTLHAGQAIDSPNHDFELVMQGDGNLVLYSTAMTALWNAGTEGNPGAYAILQPDGNFVVYSSGGTALWYPSGAYGNGSDYAYVQSDGNFVIYSASGTAVWNANTAGSATGSGSFAPTPQYGSASACPAAPAPAPAPTPTVTVTTPAPTTTVVTVAPTPRTTRHRHQLDVPVTFHWTWKGRRTHLDKVSHGKLPRHLRWRATVRSAKAGTAKHVISATTAKSRESLLRWLERQSYTRGQSVTLTILRKGYTAETVTFRVRLHHVPAVILPKAEQGQAAAKPTAKKQHATSTSPSRG